MMTKDKLRAILAGPKDRGKEDEDEDGDTEDGLEYGADPDDDESEPSAEEDLAAEVLDAIRSKDAGVLAEALRDFVRHCSDSYEPED